MTGPRYGTPRRWISSIINNYWRKYIGFSVLIFRVITSYFSGVNIKMFASSINRCGGDSSPVHSRTLNPMLIKASLNLAVISLASALSGVK